jgi:hypothetical protein
MTTNSVLDVDCAHPCPAHPERIAAALVATYGTEPFLIALGIPPAAGRALARVLAHGGSRLGVPATESHPHRSVRDHLAAARRHIDRALESTDGDAIDPDSGELHATCALGRAALAVEGLVRRG